MTRPQSLVDYDVWVDKGWEPDGDLICELAGDLEIATKKLMARREPTTRVLSTVDTELDTALAKLTADTDRTTWDDGYADGFRSCVELVRALFTEHGAR